MSHRVIHFEVHADNPDRAIAFYSEVLGWHFQKWEGPMPYWLIKTGTASEPGIDGGLVTRRGGPPVEGQAVNSFVCTVSTEDLDASVAKVLKHGGQIALPKMPIPGVGWLAYAKDSEGNLFGMMQNDTGAH